MSDTDNLQALAGIFAELWDCVCETSDMESGQIEELLVNSGLVEWQDATKEDADNEEYEVEEGDPMLTLTEEGKKLIALGRGIANE